VEKENVFELFKTDPEERVQARIEAYRNELLYGEQSTEYIQQLLEISLDYITTMDYDPALEQTIIKLNETIYWLNGFNVDIN
jgi:hypothetical protein